MPVTPSALLPALRNRIESISEVDEFIFEAADFGDLNIKDKKSQKITYRVLVYANGKYIIGETTPCYS